MKVHYLSATVIKVMDQDRHLTYCGEAIAYGVDPERYQVANYTDPYRVTCGGCMDAWEAQYPERYAEFRARWPKPKPYVRQPGEHPDVSSVRDYQASHARGWIRRYIDDDSVDDTGFMFTLHELTIGHAKELAKMALEMNRD